MHIKNVRYKNFTSVGNVPIEVSLDTHALTLLSGKNGSGKTTLLEAVVFCLYGKSFRNVNKDRLINKINGRECLTEVDLVVGTKNYTVRRGIKPNIFEISENGTVLNLDSDVREQQKFLEESILKMSYKTFCQVVILGSTNYTPFMRLDAAERRQLSDELLQVFVFTEMAKRLKSKMAVMEEDVKNLTNTETVTKTKIQFQASLLEKVRENTSDRVKELKIRFKDIVAHIDEGKKTQIRVQTDIVTAEKECADFEKTQSELWKTETSLKSIERERITLESKIFRDSCSMCGQSLDANTLAKHQEEKKDKLERLSGEEADLARRCSELYDSLKYMLPYKECRDKLKIEMSLANQLVQTKTNEGNVLVAEIQKLQKSNGDEQAELLKLKQFEEELFTIISNKNKTLEEYEISVLTSKLLKDDGIKASVIKHYIPLFNQHVMKYLSMLNFSINFSLDEKFTDRIILNGMEEYEYNSFSMGERARIDLAVMFAWRDVAKDRNSASCNLLAIDEFGGDTLDAGGLDDLLTILSELKHTNALIISHRADQLTDAPNRHIFFQKKSRFTTISYD